MSRALRSRALQTLALMLIVAGLTLGSYVWLLGWGRRTATGVNAYLSAPYTATQIGLLVGALCLLALIAGWFGHPVLGSLALAATITTCWALDAALNVQGDRNWPIGMTLVAWASLGGSLVLAGIVAEVRRMVRQRAEDAREAERERLLAIERAAEQARLAAERAEQARIAAEEEARQRAAEEARRRQQVLAAPVFNPLGRPPGDSAAARRAKVVHVLSASAAKVRSTSASRRSRSR